MTTLISNLIAILAIVSLLLLMIVRRSVAEEARDRLAAGVVFLVVLSGLLMNSVFVSRVTLIQVSALVFLLACTTLLIARHLLHSDRYLQIRASALIPLCISFCFFAVNGLQNPAYSSYLVFGRFSSVISIACVIIICSTLAYDFRALARVAVGAMLVMLSLTLVSAKVWRPCDQFKCGPFGAIFTGVFPSENSLAMFISVTILLALLIPERSIRVVCLMPLALTLYATESRTSQLALVAALLTWSLIRTVTGNHGSHTVSRNAIIKVGVYAGIVSSFLVGLIVVNIASPSMFSNRGGIWRRGMEALREDWLLGLGMDRWAYLQSVGVLPPLYPHSQYLLLLFGGGGLAVLLHLLFVANAYRQQIRSGEHVSFASGYIAFVSVIGVTEVYWNPASFDGLILVLIPLLFMTMAQGRQDRGLSSSGRTMSHVKSTNYKR